MESELVVTSESTVKPIKVSIPSLRCLIVVSSMIKPDGKIGSAAEVCVETNKMDEIKSLDSNVLNFLFEKLFEILFKFTFPSLSNYDCQIYIPIGFLLFYLIVISQRAKK